MIICNYCVLMSNSNYRAIDQIFPVVTTRQCKSKTFRFQIREIFVLMSDSNDRATDLVSKQWWSHIAADIPHCLIAHKQQATWEL